MKIELKFLTYGTLMSYAKRIRDVYASMGTNTPTDPLPLPRATIIQS
jgi:hypothetical protein